MAYAAARHENGPSVSFADLHSCCIALADRSFDAVMREAYLRMAHDLHDFAQLGAAGPLLAAPC
jgi:hypothetical protein